MKFRGLDEIVLAIAQQNSVETILRQVTEHLSKALRTESEANGPLTADDALVRIWLIGSGDLCAKCNFRHVCPDQRECLHLVSSSGLLRNPQEAWERMNVLGENAEGWSRAPVGMSNIGKIAQSGVSVATDMMAPGEDHDGLPDWGPREGVVSFTGRALLFRGKVLGVLAVFSRQRLPCDVNDSLRIFANHAAVAIGNAQAFTEIDRLRFQLEQENTYLQDEINTARGFKEIVGQSPPLQKVLRQIETVAKTEATVLITGPSGTGKELVARAIHDRSARRERPLIKVNCGAIPENLFESEFFGHVRGAFTNAVADRTGRFQLADRGTLFLDEIGDIPLSLQVKLLRVLQEGTFERVGEERTRKVDVRIIAATNKDLRCEVDAGRFRQDLYYRLSVFPVEVPPLAQRKEDIPPLVSHFLKQAAARLHLAVPRITKAHVTDLLEYDWPGNIRELQNTVERALILSQNGPLRFDLPAGTPVNGSALPTPSRESDVPKAGGLLSRTELKQAERRNIEEALRLSAGRIFGDNGAAKRLVMNPTTLASRITALGIDKRKFKR
jgi:transcriptional regulator with GAF, ATPase, and Fis domain